MTSIARLMNPTGDAEEPTPLKHAPFDIDEAVGIEIGRIIEIELDDQRVQFACGSLTAKGPRLIWFKKQKVLGWFMNLGSRTPITSGAKFQALADERFDDVKQHVVLFDEFMERLPKGVYERGVPYRSMRHWYSIGNVNSTDYFSDRARAHREYTHQHTTSVRLYIYGSLRRGGPSFWGIHGDKLKFTKRGIQG